MKIKMYFFTLQILPNLRSLKIFISLSMRIFFFILCFLSITQELFSQNKVEINRIPKQGEIINIDFGIVEIRDNRSDKEQFGNIHTSKSKRYLNYYFTPDAASVVTTFANTQFRNGTIGNIIIAIDKLEITEINEKKKSADKFFIDLWFINKNKDGSENKLYHFFGTTVFRSNKNSKKDVLTTLATAIKKGIELFQEELKKHPEWLAAAQVESKIKMNKKIYFNTIEGGDTIACNKNYTLISSDFTANISTDEKDPAYSHFVITYRLQAEDEGDVVNLNIYPKVFFLRSKSWAKKEIQSSTWLPYQQLLFNTAIAYGILFKNELENKKLSPGYYRYEINDIYNSTLKKFGSTLDQIQEESKFGTDIDVVKKWTEKIDEMLK